ncbi:hypothetical protein [uncultured Amphritea sp.]|uniref:hypothetical protein n=1 Tax=uncultured Amphritea sp. TaxID=981605 RepID=UPI0025D28222|nr:hypothetical protein [uncultured Amphritea sp.]
MCATCNEGICTNRCASKTISITPHPIPGAVGDENDYKPQPGFEAMFQEVFADKPFTPERFQEEYMQRFIPSQREVDIRIKLEQYYLRTGDSVSNKEAQYHWRGFTWWCNKNGYTADDINRAKKAVRDEG